MMMFSSIAATAFQISATVNVEHCNDKEYDRSGEECEIGHYSAPMTQLFLFANLRVNTRRRDPETAASAAH